MGLNSTDLFVVQSQSDNKLYKLSLNDLQAAIEGGAAINFRGVADLITQMPGQINPDPPVNGDIYIVENDTPTINLTWVMAGGVTSASKDDRIIWDAGNSEWILVTGGGSTGGTIIEIIGSDPIQVDTSADAAKPVISVDEATIAQNGVVARLAGPADVIHTNLSPSDTAVVTADLLQATNKIVSNNPWMRDDINNIITPANDGDDITITGADGSVNISLNADGSSVYEGQVQLKDSVYIGASPNIQLLATGSSKFGGTLTIGTGTSPAETKITLDSSGAATFAEDVEIGGGTIELNADGSAQFGGDVSIDSDVEIGEGNIELNADGSAEFDGEVLTKAAPKVELPAPPDRSVYDTFFSVSRPTGGSPSAQNAAFRIKSDASNNYSKSNIGLFLANQNSLETDPQFQFASSGKFYATGGVSIGGTVPSAPNIELDKDGSATFGGQVTLPGGGGDEQALQKQEIQTLIENAGSGLPDGTEVGQVAQWDGAEWIASSVIDGGTY